MKGKRQRGLVRVDERQRVGVALGDLVVIDDDDVEAARAGGGERVVVGGAAVAGDDDRAAGVGEVRGVVDAEAVAGVAAGDARHHPAAGVPEEAGEERAAGDPVDVVVAEDADGLPLGERARQAIDGDGEAGHGLGPVGAAQLGQARRQKAARALGIVKAAVDEQLRGHRRERQRAGERAGAVPVDRLDLPQRVAHGSVHSARPGSDCSLCFAIIRSRRSRGGSGDEGGRDQTGALRSALALPGRSFMPLPSGLKKRRLSQMRIGAATKIDE